jgi:hypothetical protein
MGGNILKTAKVSFTPLSTAYDFHCTGLHETKYDDDDDMMMMMMMTDALLANLNH